MGLEYANVLPLYFLTFYEMSNSFLPYSKVGSIGSPHGQLGVFLIEIEALTPDEQDPKTVCL